MVPAAGDISILDLIFKLISSYLLQLMFITFFIGAVLRFLIYFTVKRHEWFTQEFMKRVKFFMDARKTSDPKMPFYMTTKKLLERTYYEVFKVRSVTKRRRPDYIMDPMDRFFLVKQGSAWLIHEVLRQVRHYRSDSEPKMHEMTKTVFQNNPCYSRIFGVLPVGILTELTNLLPGLFVIAGILGTFLGIKAALPELAGLDIEKPDATKAAIANFLTAITFKMNSSIFGILYSVFFSIVNSWLSPERIFVNTVDAFENGLDVVWNLSDHSAFASESTSAFDENKDPMEALAEEYLKDEISRHTGELPGQNMGGPPRKTTTRAS
jgi:hypothetical protein